MKIFFLILIVGYSFGANAQLPKDITAYYEDFSIFGNNHEGNKPFILIVVPKKINPPLYTKTGRLLPDSELQQYLSKINFDSSFIANPTERNRNTVFTYDSSKAIFFAQGINKTNAKDYEFRVLTSQKKLVQDWSTPTEFLEGTYISGYGEDDPEMAYLGSFGASWDNFITVEVRRKGEGTLTCMTNLIWRSHQPTITATFTGNQLNDFFKFFRFFSQNERLSVIDQDEKLLLLKKDSILNPGESPIIFMLRDIVYKKVVEYRLIGNGEEGEWKSSNLEFNFIWLPPPPAGKYTLEVRYAMQRHLVTRYKFEVIAPWYRSSLFKLIMLMLLAACIGFIILLFRNRLQKIKLIQQQTDQQKKELELKSIRAQLNPHFVLNALSSIQSIINKNEIGKANQYLSHFGELMREALTGNNKEWLALEQELHTLDRYLQLERLRFGFHYEISVNKEINPTIVEIPALLLQPLVENAIKHGISSLLENGTIRVDIQKNEKDMLVTISDNGKGFVAKESKGYGIPLTQDRIALLKQLNPLQPIALHIESNENGTVVSLTFKNWLP